MRRLALLLVVVGSCVRAPPPVLHQAPHQKPSAAYRWLDVALEATARDVERKGARPPIISREVSLYVTAMYDAWAAYDARAVGTRLGGTLRRPAAERTDSAKETAIAYAVARVLRFVYPEDAAWIDAQLRAAGHEPGDASEDLATPAGIGNAAASALIAYRMHDGANQLGDEPGSAGGPYSDTTAYSPVAPGSDENRWQPIAFDDGKGGTVSPGFLTPHWYKVKPFALERADQFRPGPFPKVGSVELEAQVQQCIDFNASLTAEQKAIVELMRDGPRSTGQSGHWLRFAQDVSRRDGYGIDEDVKLFFAVGNVAFDAFIACWEAKRHYDSARPFALVRACRKGGKLNAWAGPCGGVKELDPENWYPYSPRTFVTPPFPGYPSGHSTASGAAAKMLELFTGSDRYGAVAVRVPGELTEPKCLEKEVRIELPTFSATAELAGISRVMGGYHIQADNEAGLAMGRAIAEYSWPKYRAYFEGTAPPP